MSNRQPIRFVDIVVAVAAVALCGVLLFAAVGCHAVTISTNHTATGQMLNQQQQATVRTIHDDALKAKATTDTITAKATDAQSHLAKAATTQPSPDLAAAQADLADILTLAHAQGDVLMATVTRAESVQSSLAQSSSQLAAQAKQDGAAAKELASLKSADHRRWLGLEVIGVLLMAVGLAVAFEITKTLGSVLLITGGGLAAFALFMDRWSTLTAWVLLGAAAAGAAVYLLTRWHLKIWNNTPDVVPAKPSTGA